MLIFLCQGGESVITVRAPAGAQITAAGGGESFSVEIPAGQTSVDVYPHTIGTWRVTCVYDGRTRYKDINITTFGQSAGVQFSALSVKAPSGYTITSGSESRTGPGTLLLLDTGDFSVSCSKSGTPTRSTTVSVASGTVSYSKQFSEIACTAPSDSTITVDSLSRTDSGNIIVVGTGNKTLTCSRAGIDRTEAVNIVANTVTGYTASFSYAKINVRTHPGATVSASKTGYTLPNVTADGNGNATLWVTNSAAINSTAWTVRATDANSTGVYEDKTATTNSLTADPTVYPLYRIPIIQVSWAGGSATSYGNGMDNGYATISGTNSWKMWVKASCTVTFLWIKTKVHFWGIGKGGDGSSAFYDTDDASPYGGGSGGGGGQVKTESNVTVSVNSGYTVTIGSATSFGGIMSCNAGGNGSQMSGGASGGNSGNGSSGEWVNDHSYPHGSSGGGGSGGEGVYAFGDSSFDGARYGHGGGGGAHSSSTPGYHSTTAGSGGGGAGHSGNAGRTNGNNGIFCLKPGDNI